MNGLRASVQHCSLIQFADDTTIFKTGPIPNVFYDINTDLATVYTWFCANRLMLSEAKTSAILFLNSSVTDLPNLPEVSINNKIVDLADSIKLLGITLDRHLTWNQHCLGVQRKLAKGLYVLRSTKNLFPLSVRRQLYFAIFHSHLA